MNLLSFIKNILAKKSLIKSMARRELASKYAGSVLGWFWSFLQPFVMILVFWFVFSFGFRVQPTKDVPFVVWLTAGMAPWFMFTEIISNAVVSVVGNGNLVKKTVFSSEILPVISILTGVFSHLIFLIILFGLMIFQGVSLSFYFFQSIYYFICLLLFTLGVSWSVAALNVFARDVGQVVSVLLQVGFWATPIFWNANLMSERVQTMLKINPLYYIVQGYRDSFLYSKLFWDYPYQTIYFWLSTLCMLLIGSYIFGKLKPQFADVL